MKNSPARRSISKLVGRILKISDIKSLRITTILTILLTNVCFAQDTLLIDEKTKEEVVYKVASILQEKYVFEDTGDKMSEHIVRLFKNGEYDSCINVIPFCKKLTSDLREISDDKHLYVFYSPEETYQVKAFKNMLPEKEVKEINDYFHEIERRENFGFKKVEILDGNIGYFDLEYFTNAESFEKKLAGVMNFLSNSDAIIIDLRNNGGGTGSALLPSYFLPPVKMLLGSICCRDTTQNSHYRVISDIPGKRLPDVDLYILISSSVTFSAAEDFAYTMQHLNRAVLIGETTRGGAHPIDVLLVKDSILTQIPVCESNNPITKSNWEKTGVIPDIEVSSENALSKAHIVAIENIIENTKDPEYKMELISILDELRLKY